MAALTLSRFGEKETAKKILESLKEIFYQRRLGMY
jgi:hypothetical protein